MNEAELENQCLDWFRESGWEILHGPDIAPNRDNPLRRDHTQVVLEAHVAAAFSRINPHLPPECLEQVLAAVTKPKRPDVIANNRAFHHMLLEGVPIQYKQGDEIEHSHAFLIDFDKERNNHFYAVNQFTVTGTRQPRRPDIVCFINGLPVAVLELKSPSNENADAWDAYHQIQTYKHEISDLFICNVALVVSDGYTARVGALTARQERFMPWRTVKDEGDKPQLEWQLEAVVRGFFDPALLLEYIRFFVLFENDNAAISKKIAGYHQFHAVREAVKATVVASVGGHKELRSGIKPNSKKAGVVWHTQGSGKSISMCCYAGMLLQQKEMNNPTLLVVTDRNDLDGQLFTTFANAQELLKQKPVQANDRDELRRLLGERESGGIIFTTVQKFSPLGGEKAHPVLNDRHNIVVISDEAHRSQYGLKAKLSVDGTYKYGYAKHMRDAVPNAAFIGFTGTPISIEDKDTRAVFGDYVSVYDIQDAVDDKATVPIYYEARLAKLAINHKDIEALSKQVDEVVEDEEDVGAREKTKGEWSRLEKLVGAAPRIKQVAKDIVAHYEERNASFEGKAMIVAMSRDICAHLYSAIIALRPDWHDDDPEKGQIKIIMTGSASDKMLLQSHIYNKQTKKRLGKRFRDSDDNLKIVIVRDMWLTGFDAPCCNTMYVDKPMKGHNLMQAIARVNRVFKDKQGGLVVDYIGIANALKQALKTYVDSKGRGQPTLNAEDAYKIMLEKLEVIHGMFAKSPYAKGFDYSRYENDARKLLVPTANYILGLKDGKKRFLDLILAITKAYSLCGTLDQAKQHRKEIAFFSAVKTAIAKFTSIHKKRHQEDTNSALKQILDNAVVAEGVHNIFTLCGLKNPNVGLLSDAFLEDIRQMPEKNLAVELLEKLLKDRIKAKTRNNVVQEKKYADRLQETLRRYNNRTIEAAQVIEELIQMAKDFRADMARGDALGLRSDEIAFYDALANNESATRELGDKILKKIAIEITEKLQKSTTVDWQVRESVRAKLRILVRRILQKYKYPPDKATEAVELVLQQAEVLSDGWSKPTVQ